MNAKDIKAMRWHKKLLIDAIRETGINIDYVDEVLISIIHNLDTERIENSEVNIARNEGYNMGYLAGRARKHTSYTAQEWGDGEMSNE